MKCDPFTRLSIVLAVAAALYSALPAGAADDPAPLAEQVADIEADLQQQRDALEQDRQRQKDRQQALRDRRDELAEQVLSAHEQAEQLDQEHAVLERRERELSEQVEALRQRYGRIVTGAQTTAEQAIVLLDEVPGEDQTQETLREALKPLQAAAPSDEGGAAIDEDTADALRNIITAIDRLHARGTAVTLRQAELWNAAGERETVSLLAAGHVAFAYQSTDGERVALALGSPREAAGYRWVEDLPDAVEQALRQAFTAAERGEAVTMPIDVSGELRIEAATQQQTWADFAGSGGIVMIPLGLVALAAILLILERAWVLYVRNGSHDRRVDALVQACSRGQFDQADDCLRRGRGVVMRTLAACLTRRDGGAHAIEDAVQEQLLHELPRLQRGLGGVAVLAAVAPLLGLLGTVTGIIETFGVIRAFGDTNPGLMAGGISEALVTTATGLSIAIPILLVHAVLRGRVDRIIADAERHAATLVNTLASTGPQPAGNDARPDPAFDRESQEANA